MTYGHAERNLAAVQRLSLETAELLCRLPRLDSDQASWPRDVKGQREPGRGRSHTQPHGRHKGGCHAVSRDASCQ